MKNRFSNILMQLFLLLLFCFPEAAHSQTSYCPAYPRAVDEVYVCLKVKTNGERVLSFSPRAAIHNPVKFVFPPGHILDPETWVDFGDGAGPMLIHGGDVIPVAYTGPGEYIIEYEIGYWTATGIEYWPGEEKFQIRENPDVNYDDFLPHDTWKDFPNVVPYNPPASNAYPAGNAYNNSSTGGVL